MRRSSGARVPPPRMARAAEAVTEAAAEAVTEAAKEAAEAEEAEEAEAEIEVQAQAVEGAEPEAEAEAEAAAQQAEPEAAAEEEEEEEAAAEAGQRAGGRHRRHWRHRQRQLAGRLMLLARGYARMRLRGRWLLLRTSRMVPRTAAHPARAWKRRKVRRVARTTGAPIGSSDC